MRPAVAACALPAAALASRSLRAEPWEEAGLRLVFAYSRVRPVSPPRLRGSALLPGLSRPGDLGLFESPLCPVGTEAAPHPCQPPSPRVMRAAESSFPASFLFNSLY